MSETERRRSNGIDRADENGWNRAVRAASTLAADDRIVPIALVTGAGLLVRAARSATQSRGRATAEALAGTTLLGVAFRRRRTAGDDSGRDAIGRDEGGKPVSDDASAARERGGVIGQTDENPRGVTDAVDGAAGNDEGDVRFTTSGDEPRPKPDLADAPGDPRYNGSEDAVEIDLSERSLADEASEATGPAPEQSQPAQTEETEPEPSPPADASQMDADVPDGSDDEGSDE